MLSAYASNARLVVAQLSVPEKTNEIALVRMCRSCRRCRLDTRNVLFVLKAILTIFDRSGLRTTGRSILLARTSTPPHQEGAPARHMREVERWIAKFMLARLNFGPKIIV
jgi:hypothetical protein